MKYWTKRALGAHLLVLGCAPLTFSNEEEVDFARYASVVLDVGGLDGSQRHALYLQEQLEQDSGFRSVSVDAGEADATLHVDLTLSENSDFLSDDPTEYQATIRFELVTPGGVVLTEGEVSGSDSTSVTDAAESALDEVVVHFLPSYRI